MGQTDGTICGSPAGVSHMVYFYSARILCTLVQFIQTNYFFCKSGSKSNIRHKTLTRTLKLSKCCSGSNVEGSNSSMYAGRLLVLLLDQEMWVVRRTMPILR